ncbi:MAG: hypothetical protein RR945_06950 [Erysipelotrichaceae bacterium]
MKIIDFIYWKFQDFKQLRLDRINGITKFKPFGLRMYCGRQGSGKTIGIVEQLNSWHIKYPNAKIVTNFDYDYADFKMTSLNDLLTIRNGTEGVIFAIDELQNEFSSNLSKKFPETLLSVVTMQRKQRIVILASSQVFTRVAKPLREQCYEVVDCRTFSNRWTRCKCYDAIDYNSIVDKKDPDAKFKLHKKWKHSFVQTDKLRSSYDTWAIVERLSRSGFKDVLDK